MGGICGCALRVPTRREASPPPPNCLCVYTQPGLGGGGIVENSVGWRPPGIGPASPKWCELGCLLCVHAWVTKESLSWGWGRPWGGLGSQAAWESQALCGPPSTFLLFP